jgi:surfactin synthase thioesterase subunit
MTRFLSVGVRPDARVRLFCFPYAGGGASQFHAWSRDLPPEIQVCPVLLPGREGRLAEPPFTSLPTLVEELARELSPVLNAPFALFGHSLGALIAFELARVLSRENRCPAHLFLSSSRAPQLPRRLSPLSGLDDAGFLAAVQGRYEALPAVVLEDPQLLALFLPVLRADFLLFDTHAYTPGEPLNCPLTVLGGEQDPGVRAAELAGWQVQTRAAFRSRLFPGGHFYLKSQQAAVVRAIAEELGLRTQAHADSVASPPGNTI